MPAVPPDPPPGRAVCVAGLGNPGGRYAATRHNIGFTVVTRLAEALGAREPALVSGRLETRASRGGRDVLLCMPQTYMNRSGEPVAELARQHGLGPADLVVVYDDAALPLGALRLRSRGSDGGHNGMRSIIGAMGSDAIPRLRCGIGPAPPGADMADWVLSPFSARERAEASAMADRAVEALLCLLDGGMDRAMSRYNSPPPAAPAGEPAPERASAAGDAPAGTPPPAPAGGLLRRLLAAAGIAGRRTRF